MDSIALVMACEEEENLNQNSKKLKRRVLRDSYNPFDLDEQVFKRNYRLNKDAFLYVLNILEDNWGYTRAFSVSNVHKLCAVLKFLAEGSYQVGVWKDEIVMAQSTISKVISHTINLLEEKLCPNWIKLNMSAQEEAQAKFEFYKISGFPGVLMCVGGTHIEIISPKNDRHLYFNRKGLYSMNAMIACDDQIRIKFVDARYAGSYHDAHIWSLSECRKHFERKYNEGGRQFRILGNTVYPLEPWMMTPFRSPSEGSAENVYNKCHYKACTVLELTIRTLKNRFMCLQRKLHYTPEKVVQIVNTCCALHNICLHYGVELEKNNTLLNEISSDETLTDLEHSSTEEAFEIRNRIVNL